MTADPARRPPTATNPAKRSTGGAWGMGAQLICPSRGQIQPPPAAARAAAAASPVDGLKISDPKENRNMYNVKLQRVLYGRMCGTTG